MANLYVLFPGTIPGLETIQATLGEGYSTVLLDKVESISQYRENPGVVLLSGEPTRVMSMVTMIRTMAPRLGCLVVAESESMDKFDPSLAAIVDVLPTHASPFEIRARVQSVMQISELRYLIESAAMMDEITELYNYQYYIKRLGEEISLAKRHMSPVACVIMSISFYDVYMDSYGYDFISKMLYQVAAAAKEHIRKEDMVARLADSEIAFLLPRSTEKGALMLTKRVIEKIQSIPMYMGDQIEHLHVNAGVAGYPTMATEEGEMDADTLIRFARHALHSARCSEDENIVTFSELKPYV